MKNKNSNVIRLEKYLQAKVAVKNIQLFLDSDGQDVEACERALEALKIVRKENRRQGRK
jgi:hypothetical protein